MESDRPQLIAQGLRGKIIGPVAPEVCNGCRLRDSEFAIVTCDGYPTEKKPAEVFKGTYGQWFDVPEQASCNPELVVL